MCTSHANWRVRRLVIGLFVAAALVVSACTEAALDGTPPHNIDLDALSDEVLRPVPLYVERILYTDEELESQIEAIKRGEEVPPLAKPPVRLPEIVDRDPGSIDFVLYEGITPGIYTLDVWFGGRPAGETGVVWLRAIDDERGTVLSESSLRGSSHIDVVSPLAGFEYFAGSNNNVTIYEGQWGDPYPVRFEVLYQPDDREPVVLITKTYLIEGWQR